jgi:hypothetical protein
MFASFAGKSKKNKLTSPEGDPPTLGEYLKHLFDANTLKTIEVTPA